MTGEFHSNEAPEPVGLYPHARKAGPFLFLSGVGPRVRGKKDIPGTLLHPDGSLKSYDIRAQCHSVFKNVQTILKEAGSHFDHLIDVTVFLINMKKDFPIYNEIYADYFKNCRPCRTTVGIDSLPTPVAIELKCIATWRED